MSEMADVFLLETSESFEKQEGVGMYMDITKAKFQELIDAVKARNKESENKLVWGLALVGGVVIVAIIAYAVYRFLTPTTGNARFAASARKTSKKRTKEQKKPLRKLKQRQRQSLQKRKLKKSLLMKRNEIRASSTSRGVFS